jgi:predicted N-acyltransferase
MKNFDALIVQSIRDVDPNLWKVAETDHPFSSYHWYNFCEKAMPDHKPVHILLFRDGCTFARGSFWLTQNDVLPISSLAGRKAAAWMMKRKPLLVCRSPLADVTGLALPAAGRREAITGLIETVEAYAQEKNISLVVFDRLCADEMVNNLLPDRYSIRAINESGTALDIRWNSFEDFLTSLSEQAWKDYRRHSNQASRLGIRIRMKPAVTDLSETAAFIRQVERYHGAMPDFWSAIDLKRLDMVTGTWMEARQNERLIGCGLLLRDGDHLSAKLLGLDSDVNYAHSPFLYCAIQYAIDKGIRVLHAGSGAYEVKQRLGFLLENHLYAAFTGLGPIFSTAVRLYSTNQNKERHTVEERPRY